MSDESEKKVSAEGDANTFSSIDECEEKIEKLNKKLETTADELEEVSRLYAKSVKESLDKSKRIKELEDKIDELEEELKKCKAKRDELEEQLKACQEKRAELENQLKECQDKNKNAGDLVDKIKELEDKNKKLEEQLKECQEKRAELEEQLRECQEKRVELENQLKECQDKNKNVGELEEKIKELENQLKACQEKNTKLDAKGQWIIGEYKWMPPGSTMPEGWVQVKLNKGFTLIYGEEKGETSGSVGKHKHTFWNNNSVWGSRVNIAYINERTSGSQGRKYVPFVNHFNDIALLKQTADSGNGIGNENLAAGIFAELWQYEGEKIVVE